MSKAWALGRRRCYSMMKANCVWAAAVPVLRLNGRPSADLPGIFCCLSVLLVTTQKKLISLMSTNPYQILISFSPYSHQNRDGHVPLRLGSETAGNSLSETCSA